MYQPDKSYMRGDTVPTKEDHFEFLKSLPNGLRSAANGLPDDETMEKATKLSPVWRAQAKIALSFWAFVCEAWDEEEA